MSEAGIANQDPGQRPTTTDQLFAEVVQPGNALIENELQPATELAVTHAGMLTPHPHVEDRYHEAEQVRRSIQGYGPRIEKVVDSIRGWEHDDAVETYSLFDQAKKVFELDSLLRSLAGQPVIVMKPGKSWLDVAFLEKPQPSHNNTGLQVFDALPDTPSSVQLPVYGAVTFDLLTGLEPEWPVQSEDNELRLRNLRHSQKASSGQPVRPDINPLHAHLILNPEDALGIEVNQATAYVLVGYPLVQHTLNRMLGFDPGKLGEKEVSEQYNTAVQAQQRLVQAGVRLDFDFIDGFLTRRMEVIDQETRETGPLRAVSGQYQAFLLDQLHKKYADLVQAGWIAPVTAE